MAKKSAVSKGYRKQKVKKPYLSKKEIIALCVLIVLVAAAAVLLFRYDDGALKVQDGSVVTEGDNWLIVNGSNVRGRSRYFKLAEAGEIDGFTRESSPTLTDVNVPQYTYTPEAEDAAVSGIDITTSHSTAVDLAKYTSTAMAEMDGYETGELTETELNGLACTYFTFTSASYKPEEAADSDEAEGATEAAEAVEQAAEDAAEAVEEAAEDAAEVVEEAVDGAKAAEVEAAVEADAGEGGEDEAQPEPNHFTKSLSAYIDAAHDSCIVIHVNCDAPSAEEYPDDDALLAALEQAAAAVTLESGK